MEISDYFELYIGNRIKYDRTFHINNMKIFDLKNIDVTLIEKLFVYFDNVLFGNKLSEYINKNNITFKCHVSKSLTSTAGQFYWKLDQYKKLEIGFKFSSHFFDEILQKNITNIDLGLVDEHNKKYLSKMAIEPLIVTMEHELIHLVMYVTKNHKLNDLSIVKSGHTPIFKRLVYNIFGHVQIRHNLKVGDVAINLENKEKFRLGTHVKNIKNGNSGYIVNMKKNHADVCIILPDTKHKQCTYRAYLYNELELDKSRKDIDLSEINNRLKPGTIIMYRDRKYKIIENNNVAIKMQSDDQKYWTIHKLTMLDFIFM